MQCDGTWRSDGRFGTGTGQTTCADGMTIDVIYYSQGGVKGTVIGKGIDSRNRAIQVWSGKNVLEFLTPNGSDIAYLPCISGDIPPS